MKIAYVSTLGLTGPSVHMIDLAEQMRRLGHDVLVVCGTHELQASAQARSLATEFVPLSGKMDIAGARRLGPTLEGVSIVHTHDRRAGLFGRLAARRRSILPVHTFHGLPDEIAIEVGRDRRPPRPPDVSLARALFSRHVTVRAEALLARIGALIVPSRALKDWLVRYGFPERRMRVIPYGVPLGPPPPPTDHEPVRFATAAYLDHRKGIDILIDAAARVTAPLRLDIYGDGPDRVELSARAASQGVEVVWHGFVPDFRATRPDYDVFVLPTRGDNLPVAILEAMAWGAPIIATTVGGIPEQIVHGETGLLVPPDDPAALARALTEMATSPALRRSMGKASRARISEHFDQSSVAEAVMDFYEQQLGIERGA